MTSPLPTDTRVYFTSFPFDPAVFTGAYNTTSQSYIEAAERVHQPLIYKQEVLRFHFKFINDDVRAFSPGDPVTITLGRYGRLGRGIGFAYYGVVVSVACYDSEELSVFVEIHSVPGHCINWKKVEASIWKEPPVGTRYIQPHDFLDADFEPLRANSDTVPIITLFPDEISTLVWNLKYAERGVSRTHLRPPPYGYYPSHPPQVLSPHPCPLQLDLDGSPPEGYHFDMAEWIILGAERSARYIPLGRLPLECVHVGTGAIFEGVNPYDEYDDEERRERYRKIFAGPLGSWIRR
jgi:hypothetical protein